MDPSFKFKYVSPAQLEKIIQKVQQARKDQDDAKKWQALQLRSQRSNHTIVSTSRQTKRAPLVHVSATTGSSSSSSEDSSYDLESSCSADSEDSDSDAPFAFAPLKQLSSPVRAKTYTLSKSDEKNTKSVLPPKPKFDHQRTVESIQKSQETVNVLLQQIVEQLRSKDRGIAEPLSPKAEERRKIRLAEFHARMRRNYVYTLQTLVDKLKVVVKSRQFLGAINTKKQTALRLISKLFNTSFQALQAYRNQTAARIDCLATLAVLKSILEVLEKAEDVFALFEVDHKDLSRLQSELAEEMRPAFVEAENIEIEARQPAKSTKKVPIQAKSRKLFKQKPTKIVKKPAKRVIGSLPSINLEPSQQDATEIVKKTAIASLPSINLEPCQQDAFTETDKFVPLKELGDQIKAMKSKPAKLRFLVMKHESAEGSVNADTQTAPEELESGDKATQTMEQAVMVDEARSCRMEELLTSAFQQQLEDGETDYLIQVIDEVIKQEFF